MMLWMLLWAGQLAERVVATGPELVRLAAPSVEDPYANALAAVERATVVASSDPQAGYVQLREALPALMGHMPLVAVDREAQRVVLEGELALARAALVCGEPTAATDAMSRVLFALSMDGRLYDFSVERFGPRIAGLYERGLAAIDAGDWGRIVVECPESSRVYIDGREVATTLVCSRGITLGVGEHWVWIDEDDPDHEGHDQPLFHDRVVIAEPGSSITLVAATRSPAPPPPTSTVPSSGPFELEVRPPARLAPRWTEVSMIVLGVGEGAIAASLLTSERCGPDRQRAGQCPAVDPHDVGVAVATLGACLVISGVIVLAVDERRAKRRRSR